MEFRSLSSSNVSGIHYDKNTETLTVEFTSGGRYAYKGVPEDVYDDFLSAPSPGSFFADNVKGSYAYTRVG